MLDKFNVSTAGVKSAEASQAAQGAQLHTQMGAEQAFPAESVFDIVQSELGLERGDFPSVRASLAEIATESYAETLEELSFTIGARARDARSMRDGKPDRARAKTMLGKLAEVAEDQANALHARVPDIEASLTPYEAMRQAGFDAGEMALLLGASLARGKLSDAARRRFEEALSAVMESDDWVLLLFNRLEFGASGRTGLAELRQLYRRASSQHPRLAHWFEQLCGLPDRKRKLKTLIRALAFDLSAQVPASGAQLAAVIGDLKRILQFLSVEDHCDRLARSSGITDLLGDTLLGFLIDAVQQPWLGADWILDRSSRLALDGPQQHALMRRLNEIVKLLPTDCFHDEDQREAMLDAFCACLDRLADAPSE
jgi:type III secretion system YopN/LcrE/InvE/MxiC family regulator